MILGNGGVAGCGGKKFTMKMEGKGCFIDTNLLVYSSGINLSLCQKSRQLLTSLYEKFGYLAISPQIIREFLVVVPHPLTSENPFSTAEITAK